MGVSAERGEGQGDAHGHCAQHNKQVDSLHLVHGVEIAQIQLFTMNIAAITIIYIYVHEITARMDVVRWKVCYRLDNCQWPHHRSDEVKVNLTHHFSVTH